MPDANKLMRITFAVRRSAELWYEQLGDLLFIMGNFGEI
jgi:hypothetical protein